MKLVIDRSTSANIESNSHRILYGEEKENYLEHHGIKGQTWGIRNGPPYPLDKKVYNAVVRGNDELSKEERRELRIREIKERLDSRSNGFSSIEAIPKANVDYFDEVFNKRNEKALLSGINKVSEMRDDVIKNELSKEEADSKYYNRTHNCYLCTQAGIMRLKGYEVRAQESDRGFSSRLARSILWEDSLVADHKFDDWHQAMDCIASRGPGSYGNFNFTWKTGGGHSVIWAVNKSEVVIMDGQFEAIRGVYNIESGTFSKGLDKYTDRIELSKLILQDMTNAKPTNYMLKIIE